MTVSYTTIYQTYSRLGVLQEAVISGQERWENSLHMLLYHKNSLHIHIPSFLFVLFCFLMTSGSRFAEEAI